jgi:hypothetical protein
MCVRIPPTLSVISDASHHLAKKEANPEEALKAFRAIVDQETEKGDWFVPLQHFIVLRMNALFSSQGVLKRSNSLPSCSTCV